MPPDAPKSPPENLKVVAYARPIGDHPIYAAIGNIAAEWAYFEHILDQIIGDLLPNTDNPRLACLTSQMMGTAPRYRAIKGLLKIEERSAKPFDSAPAPAKLVEKINALEGKTFAVSERRNRIVHDPWYLELFTQQPTQFRSMPSKDPVYGMKQVDKQFLAETYEKIADLVEEGEKLRVKVLEARAAWHGTKPPLQPVNPRNEDHSSKAILDLLDRIPTSDP